MLASRQPMRPCRLRTLVLLRRLRLWGLQSGWLYMHAALAAARLEEIAVVASRGAWIMQERSMPCASSMCDACAAASIEETALNFGNRTAQK